MVGHLVIDDGRNPFQWWILAACVLTGVIGLLPGDHLRSAVVDLLPAWAGYAWLAGLVIGGGIGLAAMLISLPVCLLVERVAMCLLAGQLTGYTAAVLVITGGQPAAGAVSMAAAAVAAAARIWQINRRDLPRVRAALAAVAASGRDP